MLTGTRDRRWVLPLLAAMLSAGILLGRASLCWWPGLAALALGIAAAFLFHGRFSRLAAAVCFCALGFVLGYFGYHPSTVPEGDYRIEGVICDEVRKDDRGRARTYLTDVRLNGKRLAGRCYWSCYPGAEQWSVLMPGTAVRFTGRVYVPGGAQNPGGFDFREYLLGQGVAHGVYGATDLTDAGKPWSVRGQAAAWRASLRAYLCRVMGDESDYAAAMLLGSREALPEDDTDAFRRVGVAHVLTISGFHVGVLAWLLLRVLGACRPGVRLGIMAAVLTVYCFLTGLSASVVRAALLLLLAQLGRILHRQVNGLWLWFACYCATLLACPAQLTSAGFQLTYGAVLGLMTVTPAMERLWKPCRKGTKWIWRAFCASIGAQTGVLLPMAWWFQKLPLLGTVLNLLVLPYASVLIVVYWAVLLLGWIPGVGMAAGLAASLMTRGLTAIIHAADALPHLQAWVPQANGLTALGWACILLGCARMLRVKRRAVVLLAGAAVLAVSLIPLPQRGTEYIQLSVGNADAAVLLDDGQVTVIDTGEGDGVLSTYLRQRRLSIDTLVVTHLHRDHALGLRDLLDEDIPVKELLLPWGAEHASVTSDMLMLVEEMAARGTQVRHVGRCDAWTLPNGTLRVLWPEAGRVRPGQDANASSLTLLLETYGTRMLLTGDLDGKYENYAAEAADILKAPHHGSLQSSGESFLKQVSPRVTVVSCGDEKRRVATEERLPDSRVFGTENRGAVTIRFDEDGYAVETFLHAP